MKSLSWLSEGSILIWLHMVNIPTKKLHVFVLALLIKKLVRHESVGLFPLTYHSFLYSLVTLLSITCNAFIAYIYVYLIHLFNLNLSKITLYAQYTIVWQVVSCQKWKLENWNFYALKLSDSVTKLVPKNYAMVGISVNSGKQQSGKCWSGKRRSAVLLFTANLKYY